MAIDDNTSYELTGAQVKDLANKIKAKAADNIFVGATSALPGSKGLVPAPQAADDTKFLSGDGTWKTVSGGGTTYTAGTNIQISAQNVISATDTTYSAFTGATSQQAGAAGLVPAPTTSDPDKFLKGDGTWATPSGGGSTVTKVYTSYYNGAGYGYTFYKDSARTTTFTYQEILDALQAGSIEWHEDYHGEPNIHYLSYSGYDTTSTPGESSMWMGFDKKQSSASIFFFYGCPNSSLSDPAFFVASEFDYSLPTATASKLGGVKVGNNLSISSGVLSASDALIIREWS